MCPAAGKAECIAEKSNAGPCCGDMSCWCGPACPSFPKKFAASWSKGEEAGCDERKTYTPNIRLASDTK